MSIFKNLFSNKPQREQAPPCAAVICAAGSSSRMNGGDKLFMDLGGIPVLARTMLMFQNCEQIGEIIVSARSGDIAQIGSISKEFGITKLRCIVCGGATRLLSVYNGVAEVSKRYSLVAVHDGARPLVTDEVILPAIEAALRYGAAAPYIPVKDTIKKVGDGAYMNTLDRSGLAAMQTPQVFRNVLLIAALQNAMETNADITDDAQALELIGIKVAATAGSEENIKITTPVDLVFAEAILQRRYFE